MHFPKPISFVRLLGICLLTASCGYGGPGSLSSPGRPLIETFSAREIGADAKCWTIVQGRDSKILVGADGLAVYDGSSWKVSPVPGSYCVRAIAEDAAGRIWVGAINEIGWFFPNRSGVLEYHSLVPQLPAGTGPLGDVWNVFVDGPRVVFITQNRIISWENGRFQVLSMSESRRLLASQSAGKIYLHHVPSGLYVLADGQLRKIVPAEVLQNAPVFWVEEEADGAALFGTAAGFFTYRQGVLAPFAPEASAFLRQNRVTSILRLPNRTLVASTFNGGIAVVSDTGRLIRVLAEGDDLPSRAVNALCCDRQGSLWAALGNYVSRIDYAGCATLFNAKNGLTGHPTFGLYGSGAALEACTEDGLFKLESPDAPLARFAPDPRTRNRYAALTQTAGRLYGARAHGIDELTPDGAKQVWVTDNDVLAMAAGAKPGTICVADGYEVIELSLAAAGPAAGRKLALLPDAASSLCVGLDGAVWAGTQTRGLFQLQPGPDGRISAIRPSGLSAAGDGAATVVRVGADVVAFVGHRGFILRPGAEGWGAIGGFPEIGARAVAGFPDGTGLYVAFDRTGPDGLDCDGLGSLQGLDGPRPAWREFDLPTIAGIGRIRAMALNGPPEAPLLWLGGTEGVLRVEPDGLSPVSAPPAPTLEIVNGAGARGGPGRQTADFPYSRLQLRFHFVSVDFPRQSHLFYQTRLLGRSDEWSAPSASSKEGFSYLWEGRYEFQVRAVGESGWVSPLVSLPFRIRPPWFRNPWAYLAYLAGAGAGVAGLMRARHRSMLARNRELEQLVRERTAELERTSAAKDDFVASISHEIRNPLNGVIGLAAALDGPDLNPEQRRQLSMMRECAAYLSSLIEDILDFSKIEAGEVTIEARPFDVRALMESVVAVAHEQSASAGIPVDLDLGESVPAFLVGDQNRIRQILLNYVVNALKYACRGRVTLSARAVPLAARRHAMTFTVADQGPGIPASEQAEIFTKFKRGESARKRNVGGAGLGLAVCRSLAEKMGGATAVDSEPGNGAFFHLRLTLAEPAGEPRLAEDSPPPAPFAFPAAALVVEDMEFNAVGLVAMLRQMGVQADVAGSGEAALQKFLSKPYLLVFVDCDLPGMSGMEFARLVRRQERAGEAALIIATTASATRQVVEECRAAGMNGFVGKPITVGKLRAEIGRHLRTRRIAASVNLTGDDDGRAYRLDSLVDLTRDEPARLRPLIGAYIQELDGYLDGIEIAVRTVDYVRIKRTAHKLVSHLSVLEHSSLLLLAQQIEESAVNRSIEEAGARLAELRAGIRGFRQDLLAESEKLRAG